MRYIALIDGGPGAYGVMFPDLPVCTAMANTLDQALTTAADALRDWVNTVEASGSPIPAARSADTLRTDPEVTEALAEGATLAAILVVRSTGKPVRANLSLDEGIVTAIDAAAHKRGIDGRDARPSTSVRTDVGRPSPG
jgi:predicted RNase H-like HicB family nuclease